jgi:hypothetical protein
MVRQHWRWPAVIAGAAALLLAGCSAASVPSASGAGGGGRGGGALRAENPSPGMSSASQGGSLARPGVAHTAGQIVPAQAALVVRDGTITLGVRRRDVVQVFDRISTLAERLGGFVESSATGTGGGIEPSPLPVVAGGASLVLRVPAGQFALLAQQVKSLGTVRFEQLLGHDVTGESVDLIARIKNLNSEEAALRGILSRAGTITDVLQVQNELFTVEGEVEQLSAQESSLLNHATFATLTVSIEPGAAPVHKRHKTNQNIVARALHLAAHNTVVVLKSIALVVGWSFPLLVAAAALTLAWLMRRQWRRRRAAPVA